ncbi:hypothetical protein TNCT_427091 [Trichonephila clavata]|uniref:Uncharacterized protein n=1 Tax=Trichonephila clavata TaxID=2740835 RepID=A0A8X6FSQ9_TRICU|nr:hypothetical protein TNCT_427091 [Trichonephila clavata]
MQTRFIEIHFRVVALNSNSFTEIRFRLVALNANSFTEICFRLVALNANSFFTEIRFRLVALYANSFVKIRFRLVVLDPNSVLSKSVSVLWPLHILIPNSNFVLHPPTLVETNNTMGGFLLKEMEMVVSPPAKSLVESLPERPVTPLERVDPSVLRTGAHVKVTSRLPTPPLMTRCNKSTQAYSSHLELGKRLLEHPPFLPNKKTLHPTKDPCSTNSYHCFVCARQSSYVEIRYVSIHPSTPSCKECQ